MSLSEPPVDGVWRPGREGGCKVSTNRLPVRNPILDFYHGHGRDDRGRSFQEILTWDDDQLEEVHDYIQWLFPLPERSGANPLAPVLDGGTVMAFRAEPALRDKLHQAFMRMLEFYGLEMSPEGVAMGGHFSERSGNWLWPGNHNHLRLTRILRSLTVLGLETDAQSLYACLKLIYKQEAAKTRPAILPRTFEFWTTAVRG